MAGYDSNLHVTINDTPLYGVDSLGCTWLVSEVNGVFDGAASTLSTTQHVWADGYYTNRPFYKGRSFTITGNIYGDDTVTVYKAWERFKGSLLLGDQTLLVDFKGIQRLATVRQADAALVDAVGDSALKFSLQFVSTESVMYGGGNPLTGSTGLPQSSGGLTYPYQFQGDGTLNNWIFTEKAESGSIEITSNGTADSNLILRIDGYVTRPQVEHVQTGRVLALDFTVGNGHYVTFNTAKQEVMVDGTLPAAPIVSRREWFKIQPGRNVLRFSSADNTQSGRLSIRFREAYK